MINLSIKESLRRQRRVCQHRFSSMLKSLGIKEQSSYLDFDSAYQAFMSRGSSDLLFRESKPLGPNTGSRLLNKGYRMFARIGVSDSSLSDNSLNSTGNYLIEIEEEGVLLNLCTFSRSGCQELFVNSIDLMASASLDSTSYELWSRLFSTFSSDDGENQNRLTLGSIMIRVGSYLGLDASEYVFPSRPRL